MFTRWARALMLAGLVVGFSLPVQAGHMVLVCRGTEKQAVERMLAKNPGAEISRRLVGEALDRFIGIYNAIPPETDIVADVVLVFTRPGATQVYVLMFHDECLFFYGAMSRQRIQELLPGDFRSSSGREA